MLTPKELVLNQIQHHATTPVPCVLSIEPDLALRLDAHFSSPEWRKCVHNDIHRLRAFDDSKYQPIDATYSVDVFSTLWRTDLMPMHVEKPALTEPSFDGYVFPEVSAFLDEGMMAKAQAGCERHSDKFLVANMGWGLFERTWTIRGFENALTDAIAEPDFYEELLDRLLALQLQLIKENLRLPVDGIMFSDDWGDQRGVLLGPERWRQLIKPRVAALYEAVHAAGKFTLSHCCGNVTDIIPDLIEIGLDVLESVQPEAMNPFELKRRFGGQITFWGGLGSQSTLAFGTPATIRSDIKRLCTEMAQGGGYILAAAKTLMNSMPIENAVAVVDCFDEQRNKGRNAACQAS